MFYSLTGKITAMTTLNTLSKIGKTGEEATLYTYLNVREDALDLFGFYTEQELACFKQLISVSGVGPKAALAILSQLSPDKLALCIASGDVKAITKARGVGPKLAQRVVLGSFISAGRRSCIFRQQSRGCRSTCYARLQQIRGGERNRQA